LCRTKTKIYENMAYIERENVSHEFDMDEKDSDMDLLFCESPTSVWDDVEKEQDPLVMAAELAHRGHLDRLQRIKSFMEEELKNLQQNPLLWQDNARKIFNSMRISLNHMKAVVDATASRDLTRVSPVASASCYNFQQKKKMYSPQPRPLH